VKLLGIALGAGLVGGAAGLLLFVATGALAGALIVAVSAAYMTVGALLKRSSSR
jgi:hypothetical protein